MTLHYGPLWPFTSGSEVATLWYINNTRWAIGRHHTKRGTRERSFSREKLESIEETVNEAKKKDEVMIVHDSNGKYFNPSIMYREVSWNDSQKFD